MLTPQTMLQNGRYQIVQPIGQGGMGAVYEAYDHRLRKKVAVKEALVGGATLHRAFEREAQRLANLNHPTLPNVIDHFWEHQGHYLVMDFIEGQDFGQMLEQRGHPFPLEYVYRWAEELLNTLEYLHSKGVIHRDLKPANIKLTPEGRLILLDFGLAKGGPMHKTVTGRSLLGYSMGFAPPEQMIGSPTDARSDLYSLGATLYALMTGQIPVDARLRQQAQQHRLPDPLRPANEVHQQVPPAIGQFLSRVMALDLTHRPNNAQTMRAMLQQARSGGPFHQGHQGHQAHGSSAPTIQVPPSHPPQPQRPSTPQHFGPSHPSHAQPPSTPQHFGPSHPSHAHPPSTPQHFGPSHPSHAHPPSTPQHFGPSHPSHVQPPSRPQNFGGYSSHAQPPSTPQHFGPSHSTTAKPNRNRQVMMALVGTFSVCFLALCAIIMVSTLPGFVASPTEIPSVASSPIPDNEGDPSVESETASEQAQFHYEQGFAEYKKDKNDQAIIHFDQAIELEPAFAKAWAGRGLAYQHKGDYNQAFADCNKAIELEPEMADGYYCRGYTYEVEGDYEQGIEDLTKALELNYEIIGWVYQFRSRAYDAIGNTELKDADLAQAIEAYKQFISETPKDATFYSYLGFAYADQEEYELAIENFDEAIRLYPEFANAYLGRGGTYDFQEKYDKAFNDYTKAIELNHEPPGWAFTGRGFVRISQGSYEDAISDLNQSIQDNPNYARAYSGRGWALTLQGKFEQSIEDCQQAIRLKPKDPIGHLWCAIIYNRQENDDQAITKFTDAINLKPDLAVAYNRRAQVYARQGNIEQALSDSDKAVSLEPDDHYVYQDRGYLFVLLEDYDKAIENYNRAIELNPDSAYAYSARGWAYYLKGSSYNDEALADCQKAIELDSEDGYHYNICGIVSNREGDQQQALNYYTSAIQYSPEDPVLYNNRAYTYEQLDETDKAIADYRRALELGDDSSGRAKEGLEELGVTP